MKEILNVIHNTIYQFFDVCSDDEEVPMSDKDKLLLKVNKAICNNLKALEQESKTGYWINLEKTKYKGQVLPFWGRYECSKCGGHGEGTFNYCPNCGADMREE